MQRSNRYFRASPGEELNLAALNFVRQVKLAWRCRGRKSSLPENPTRCKDGGTAWVPLGEGGRKVRAKGRSSHRHYNHRDIVLQSPARRQLARELKRLSLSIRPPQHTLEHPLCRVVPFRRARGFVANQMLESGDDRLCRSPGRLRQRCECLRLVRDPRWCEEARVAETVGGNYDDVSRE